MTLLPTESWQVIARPDLPAYELNKVDPVDGCTVGLEDHHLWRRSFGADFREAWWVELEDGTVVPNRVALSRASHQAITENQARIMYEDGEFVWYDLARDDPARTAAHGQAWHQVGTLNPQPGPQGAVAGAPGSATPGSDHGAMQLTVDGDEVSHDLVAGHSGVWEKCSKCKGVGRLEVNPEKDEQPQTAPRKKVTWSVRVPKDKREDGYEVLDTNVENVVELLAKAGLIRDPNKGANYYSLIYALAFFQQNFKPEEEAVA